MRCLLTYCVVQRSLGGERLVQHKEFLNGTKPAYAEALLRRGEPDCVTALGSHSMAASAASISLVCFVLQLLEAFAFGGFGVVVGGEDAFEQPGSGAPAAFGFAGPHDDREMMIAELFAGLEQGDDETGVLALPARDGGGVDAGEGGGAAVGDAVGADDRDKEIDNRLRVSGGTARGAGVTGAVAIVELVFM